MWNNVIFLQILIGLNSEFNSFISSLNSCHNKAKEPSVPYCFIRRWREKNLIRTFSKSISAIVNANNRIAVSISYDNIHHITSTK